MEQIPFDIDYICYSTCSLIQHDFDMAYKRRRKYTRRRYSKKRRFTRSRRTRGATKIQRTVRSFLRRKKARGVIRRFTKRRFTRRMNNPYTQKKMMTFSRLLPASMCTPTGYYTQYGSQHGIISSDGNTGTLEGGLQAGFAFYDGNVPTSLVSPINDNFKKQLSLWRQCRCTSVKFTFIPYGTGAAIDQAGVNNVTVPGQPCAPQAIYQAGEKVFKNLLFFTHVDSGRYLDPSITLAALPAMPSGIVGSKISLGSETNAITDAGTHLRRISSVDRRPFSITVRSAPRQSEMWNWKKSLIDNATVPQNMLRGGSTSLVDCSDVLDWLNGNWVGPMSANNAAMYSACMLPVLSYKCIAFPPVVDDTGRTHGYPVFKVIVQSRVLFVGKKSVQVGGDPNP